MSEKVRLDTLVRKSTKKLLEIAKAEMEARNYDEVLYWLARIYVDVCRSGKICEPEKIYKKLLGCVKNDVIFVH
jgi:hypothetical protein